MSGPARRRLGALAASGPLAFASAWALSAALQPGFNLLRDHESSLAAIGAAHPWVTVTGEFLLGASLPALAAGLAGALTGREAAVGCSLLLVAGLAIIVQALAREDCIPQLAGCASAPPAQPSWHQALHESASGLAFLLLSAAPLVLAQSFRRHPHWRHLTNYSTATSATGLVFLVAYVAVADTPWAGLAELIALTPPLAWLTTVGLNLSRPQTANRRLEHPRPSEQTAARKRPNSSGTSRATTADPEPGAPAEKRPVAHE